MTEREQVIAELLYLKHDCLEGSSTDQTLDKAIALLEAQEPIEARLHLCESCMKEYPECDATIDGIEFGCGVGNDNIIGCTAYVNRWKAQEPVKPIIETTYGTAECDDPWGRLIFCGACGKRINEKYNPDEDDKYCKHCGKPVKWE